MSTSTPAAITIDTLGNAGIGEAPPTGGFANKLVVNGNVAADTLIAPSAAFAANAVAFGLASTTAPSAVLTADGSGVDLYKLAIYNYATTTALTVRLTTDETRLTSLEARVAALESGAIGTGTTTPFSTSTLAAAFTSLGAYIQQGIAQFGTLVADQFVAATNSAGASSAGTVTILAGNTVALVNNSYVLPTSKIFVTLTASTTGSWYISEKNVGSFKLVLSQAQTNDVSFDYFIVQTQGQIATSTPQTGSSSSQSNGPDTTAPVITLIGDNPVHLAVGATYVEPGVTVVDNVDGSITPTYFVDGLAVSDLSGLDTSSATTHIITYSAIDQAGNRATATRSVIVGGDSTSSSTDTTPPVVTLVGDAAMQLNVGDTWTDPGATALDNVDGDLTTHIIVVGTVDTTTAGTYSLTYSATDAAGNTGSATRTVTVVASTTSSGGN